MKAEHTEAAIEGARYKPGPIIPNDIEALQLFEYLFVHSELPSVRSMFDNFILLNVHFRRADSPLSLKPTKTAGCSKKSVLANGERVL